MRRLLAVLAALILLTGCSGNGETEAPSEYFMYYLSLEANKVVENAYEPEASSGDEMIQEFVDRLNETPEGEDYQRLMPKDVKIDSYSLEDSTLILTIGGDYEQMERPREVLVRVGLVRAFTQISGVDRVQIVTENGELKDSAGNVIGAMTRESFVENACISCGIPKRRTREWMQYTPISMTAAFPSVGSKAFMTMPSRNLS